jgi:hypothetical protein
MVCVSEYSSMAAARSVVMPPHQPRAWSRVCGESGGEGIVAEKGIPSPAVRPHPANSGPGPGTSARVAEKSSSSPAVRPHPTTWQHWPVAAGRQSLRYHFPSRAGRAGAAERRPCGSPTLRRYRHQTGWRRVGRGGEEAETRVERAESVR